MVNIMGDVMIRGQAICAVIFDMDGLMLDTERLAQIAWQKAGAERGFSFPVDVYLAAVGRTKQDTGIIFQQAFGASFPFDELYARKQELFYTMLESEPIPTKAGLFELLDLVDELGLAKAVATSTARPLALKKLTTTGLLARFTTIVGGDEVAHGKPAPDIFLAAAARLGVDAARCLVLEDSEAGVWAAHAAGMTPIMVPDLKTPSTEVAKLARMVVSSLHEVVALLQ